MISPKIEAIIEKAQRRCPLTREDCIELLRQPATSLESAVIRSVANDLIRKKNDGAAIIIGQIAIDVHACNGGCAFCSFGESHTCLSSAQISDEALKEAIDGFCKEGDLFGLYLMTMADSDEEYIIRKAAFARSVAPKETQIWINTGDHGPEFYRKLAEVGVCGAYHVCRLGEGTDTKLDPDVRKRSMQYILDAGLDLFSCCEPIGPEHTVEELADSIMLCVDMGVTQFGAMRRIAVPGSPKASLGQISDLEMAHVMGCVGLVYASVESAVFFGIHEPCEMGYLSGANFVTAEAGASPRDTSEDTSKGRGWDMNACRKLLFECGFNHLLKGDRSKIALNYDYLVKTDSL